MIEPSATDESERCALKPPVAASRGLYRWLASTAKYAADLALPPVCIACRSPLDRHGLLCPSCWRGADFIRPPVCDRLGTPMPLAAPGLTVSAAAMAHPPVFARARAAALYTGVIRDLIHALKYQDRHESLPFLARIMHGAGAGLLRETDVIVAVPLSLARLRARRFNQAALLANGAARLSRKPFAPMALIRRRDTASQVGLTLSERRANVAAAFAVPHGQTPQIAGRRVLLIDDVITTGATGDACAAALLAAGAQCVNVLAAARVARPAEPENW